MKYCTISSFSHCLLSSSNPLSRISYCIRWKVELSIIRRKIWLRCFANISSLLFCTVERAAAPRQIFPIYLYRPALLNSDNPRRRRCKSLYSTPRFTIHHSCHFRTPFPLFDFQAGLSKLSQFVRSSVIRIILDIFLELNIFFLASNVENILKSIDYSQRRMRYEFY